MHRWVAAAHDVGSGVRSGVEWLVMGVMACDGGCKFVVWCARGLVWWGDCQGDRMVVLMDGRGSKARC